MKIGFCTRAQSAWISVTAIAVLLLLAYRWYHRSEEKNVAVLGDGRKLVLEGVTFGLEHSNTLTRESRLHALFSRLPDVHLFGYRLLPTQTYRPQFEDCRISLSEPKAVLWFVAPPTDRSYPPPGKDDRRIVANPPRAPRSHFGAATMGLRWQIVASDGTSHGSTSFRGVPGGSFYNLFPLCLDSYPRRLPEFTVRLFEPTRQPNSDTDVVLIGEFVVRNPNPYRGPEWQPDPLPARREDKGVICVLESFRNPRGLDTVRDDPTHSVPPGTRGSRPRVAIREMHSVASHRIFLGGTGSDGHADTPFPQRDDHRRATATFTVVDRSPAATPWELRDLTLRDPTGNVSYPCAVDRREIDSRTTQFVCTTIPLWSDDPAWKIRIRLSRSGIPPSHRILTLKGIPFPGVPETSSVILQTNFLGLPLSLRAVGGVPPPAATNPPFTSVSPSLLFEFFPSPIQAPGTPGPMVDLLDLRDDAGAVIDSTRFQVDRLYDVRNWRLEFYGQSLGQAKAPINPASLDVKLGFPEELAFEFLVPSTPTDTEEPGSSGGVSRDPGMERPLGISPEPRGG